MVIHPARHCISRWGAYNVCFCLSLLPCAWATLTCRLPPGPLTAVNNRTLCANMHGSCWQARSTWHPPATYSAATAAAGPHQKLVHAAGGMSNRIHGAEQPAVAPVPCSTAWDVGGRPPCSISAACPAGRGRGRFEAKQRAGAGTGVGASLPADPSVGTLKRSLHLFAGDTCGACGPQPEKKGAR
jgi:hypothetical protein